MYALSEEHRWYIIIGWKKGSINILRAAHFLNCHVMTVRRILHHYCRYGNVSIRHSPSRPPALNPTQVKNIDRTIQKIRSATAAELLSLTRFNTTEGTIQRHRLSLGYHPRKTPTKINSTNMSKENCYRFVALHHNAHMKKYIFADECYTSLPSTEQTVWYKQGERTPNKEISSLKAHINLIDFIWWNGFVFRRFDTSQVKASDHRIRSD